MKSTYQVRQASEANVTLRKLNCNSKQLQHGEILVALKAGQETFQIAQTRIIKNGSACFYGESFFFSDPGTQIIISVLSEAQSSERTLAEFTIHTTELSYKKNTFALESGDYSLILEASFIHENTHFPETEADRFIEDFEDLKPIVYSPKNDARKMYSPMAKGEKRGKRMSFRASKEDTVSQRISESPQKLTLHTSDTWIRIKRENGSVKEKNKKKTVNEKPRQNSQIVHPVFSPPKNKKMAKKIQFKQPMTPQNTSSTSMFGRKKAEYLLAKVNLRSLIYTSVLGIISGVTAAKAVHM